MRSLGPRLHDFHRAAVLGGWALASTPDGFEVLAAADEPRELFEGNAAQVEQFLKNCVEKGRPAAVVTRWREAVRVETVQVEPQSVRLAFTAKLNPDGFVLLALDMPDFGAQVEEAVRDGISEGSGRCSRPGSSPDSPGGSPRPATTSKRP